MTKYAAATPGGTAQADDVFGITRDPAGTPLDRSQTPQDVADFMAAATLTLTNKTMTAAKVTTPASADWTGAVNLESAAGDIQDITLTGAVTGMTDLLVDGESVLLQIDDGTGDFAIVWPVGTVWISDGGLAPGLQPTGDTFVLLFKNGTALFGDAKNGT